LATFVILMHFGRLGPRTLKASRQVQGVRARLLQRQFDTHVLEQSEIFDRAASIEIESGAAPTRQSGSGHRPRTGSIERWFMLLFIHARLPRILYLHSYQLTLICELKEFLGEGTCANWSIQRNVP
jgi:hypothetical protein